MKLIITLGLLLAINLSFFSQVSSVKRIEFDLKDDFSTEFSKPVKENGLIVICSGKDKTNGQFEWKFDLYNTNLEVEKSTSVFIDSKMYFTEHFSTDDNFYLLFKSRKGEYIIYNLNCKDGSLQETQGELPKKSSISSMMVINDFAYLSGHLKRSPILFSLNLSNGLKKVIPLNIPGVKTKKTSISNIQLIKNSNEVFVYVDAPESKTKTNKYIVKLNSEGDKEDIFCLTKGIEQNIIEISATKTGDNEYIYTGSYSEKPGLYSEGIFISKVTSNNIDFINFYNFNKFDNFFAFLSEKRQLKIEKKKERKEKRGKELKIRYSIEGHDVIKKDDNYFFIGEAYYATYRTETYTTFVNGQAVQQTRHVFDGFQYTHGIITGFDKSGNLMWDNTFKMWPRRKPFTVKKFISVSEEKENINMAFANNDSIVSMTLSYDGEIINTKKSNAIETNNDNDKTKYSYSNLDYWYDDYFVAYGEQKIKNKTSESDKKRRYVYFINKIKF